MSTTVRVNTETTTDMSAQSSPDPKTQTTAYSSSAPSTDTNADRSMVTITGTSTYRNTETGDMTSMPTSDASVVTTISGKQEKVFQSVSTFG